MAKLHVQDLMSDAVMVLDARDPLHRLADLITEEHVRHVPIVDAEHRLIGLVTERDLLRTGLLAGDTPTSEQREQLQDRRIDEIMQRDVFTAEPDQDLAEAAATMLDNKLGCLPVVVDNDLLVGILTEADFVQYFAPDLPDE